LLFPGHNFKNTSAGNPTANSKDADFCLVCIF